MHKPLLALGLLLFTACTSTPSMRDTLDMDYDGRVSEAEFHESFFRASFSHFDVNADGSITLSEWTLEGDGDELTAVFKTVDVDTDGRITYSEFSSHPDRVATLHNVFTTLDVDGDGFIVEGESTDA